MAESEGPALDFRQAAATGMTLAIHAHLRGDRTALAWSEGEVSFQTLNARANQLARALRSRGVGAGDGIALVCSNRPEFVETYYAALRSGLRITPINWHLTGVEMAYIVDNCEATAIVADARFAVAAREAAERSPKVRARLAIGAEIAGFEDYAQALAAEPEHDLEDPSLGGQMLYTSGTTGHPKGVYRRGAAGAGGAAAGARGAAAPAAGAMALAAAFRYDAETDAHLLTGPLYHAAPLAFSLTGVLARGVKVVMMDGWDAEEALELIARHRVTHTHMVPTMFHRMLGLPDEVKRRHDTSSLRVILHGAAPCPVPVKQALMDWLGPIVYEYYAATEGWGSFVAPEEWLAHPGTVGKPNPDQIKIVDDDGKEVAAGVVGRLFLRAPNDGGFEYYKDAEKTASAYSFGEGYFTLGDMGYFDADGYLYLSDRTADLIISGGVNIYPAEVDAVLLTHPAVADVATIGIPNEDWGEEVRSVVVAKAGFAPGAALGDELIAYCRDRLAHFKCPRAIDFVDELPRHDTGKIYRRLVREKYWQGRDRHI